MEDKRISALDTVRGVAAFCVMWVHTSLGGDIWIISPIMLPAFFFVAGCLLKQDNAKSFFKNRILKLLLPWILVSYVQAYANVSTAKQILADGSEFWRIGKECSINVLLGRAVWFVPALIVALIIAYLIIRLCGEEKPVLMLTVSVAAAVAAYFFMRPHSVFNVWNLTAATINQFFVVAGFVAKRLYRQHGEIRKMPLWWIPVYIAELAVCRMLWQMEYFDVRNNEYGQLFGLYFILALSGIAAVFSVATRVSKIPLLTFMGRHSLLYFAFGPHGYVIGRTVLKTAMRILQVETVSDNFNSLFVCTMASIAWILPAMLIDRICPVLNGKWTWKR